MADLLRATGFTTRVLARHIEMNQASVSRLMNGKQNNPATLERVLRLLGYDVHIVVTKV